MDDGRSPLSGREYYAIRELFGLVNALERCSDTLDKRVRTIPGGLRDLRMLVAVAGKLLTKLLTTVPVGKLKQIRRELDQTCVEVKIGRSIAKPPDNVTYVEEPALDRLVESVFEWQCAFCSKTPAEVKACQTRKDIESMYQFDFPKSDKCPFDGQFSIGGLK